MIYCSVFWILYTRRISRLCLSSFLSDLLSLSGSGWLCFPSLSLISKRWDGRSGKCISFFFFLLTAKTLEAICQLNPPPTCVSVCFHSLPTIPVCEATHGGLHLFSRLPGFLCQWGWSAPCNISGVPMMGITTEVAATINWGWQAEVSLRAIVTQLYKIWNRKRCSRR